MVAKVCTLKKKARRKGPPIDAAGAPPSAPVPHATYAAANRRFTARYPPTSSPMKRGQVSASSA